MQSTDRPSECRNPQGRVSPRASASWHTMRLVMRLLTPDYDMVTKVTIIPRSGGAGGFTLFTPPEERLESGMYSKKYLDAQLTVALGGRVAEELIYGKEEITT